MRSVLKDVTPAEPVQKLFKKIAERGFRYINKVDEIVSLIDKAHFEGVDCLRIGSVPIPNVVDITRLSHWPFLQEGMLCDEFICSMSTGHMNKFVHLLRLTVPSQFVVDFLNNRVPIRFIMFERPVVHIRGADSAQFSIDSSKFGLKDGNFPLQHQNDASVEGIEPAYHKEIVIGCKPLRKYTIA